MEQNIQQAEQQNAENKLPIKTKIAIWLMMFLAIFPAGIAIKLWLDLKKYGDDGVGLTSFGAILFSTLAVVLIVALIILLILRNKIIWTLIVISLGLFLLTYGLPAIIALVASLISGEFFSSFNLTNLEIYFLPILPSTSLILLIIDRKNFWKVAR